MAPPELEGLSQAIARLLSDSLLSRDLRYGAGLVPTGEQANRQPPAAAARGFRDGRAGEFRKQGARLYEIGKDQFLMVEDEVLEAIQVESTHTIEIDSFVPRDQIDERYLDSPIILRLIEVSVENP